MKNEKTHRMMMFPKGREVVYKNYTYTVNHVVLRRYELYLALDGVANPVPADEVYCEPTVLPLYRVGPDYFA